MADLYPARVVDHDMLDVEAAARQALALAGESATRSKPLAVVALLPFADTLTLDARAAIATRVWVLLEDVAA